MYAIEITPAALRHITEIGKREWQGEYAIVIADTHCCGATLHVELRAPGQAASDPHLVCQFPKETTGQPFDVWIEHQALQEESVPDQILIDLKPTVSRAVLELKNGRFERPYEG